MRNKIPILELETGQWFDCRECVATTLGVSDSAVINHLAGRSWTLKGKRYEYEHKAYGHKEDATKSRIVCV